MIVSEFAKGVSFNDLNDEQRKIIAKMILEREAKNLFDSQNQIIFDPDRHPGNYRIEVLDAGTAQERYIVRPIDFGQLIKVSSQQRNQIFDLFSLSQILRQTGATEWGAQEAIRILGIDPKSADKIKTAMAQYFPNKNSSEATAYYTLLAALNDAGHGVSIEYFDFIRSIIQLKQYAKRTGVTVDGPIEKLTAEVKTRASEMEERMKSKLHTTEKIKIGIESIRELAREKGMKAAIKGCFHALSRAP